MVRIGNGASSRRPRKQGRGLKGSCSYEGPIGNAIERALSHICVTMANVDDGAEAVLC